MRIVTWNVNGIRRIHREYQKRGLNTFPELLEHLGGDIICLQELKAERSTIDPAYVNVPGWRSYFTFPVDKKAYSGVAIYVRNPYRPVTVETALCAPDYASNSPAFVQTEDMIGCYPINISINEARNIDREGRVVMLDFGSFVLIGTYCPAGAESEDRIAYRRLWWRALFERCQRLITAGRSIIMIGDLNVNCHSQDTVEADEDEYKYENLGPVGKTFYRILHGTPASSEEILTQNGAEAFMVDATRHYHPDREKMFSCWSVKLAARAGNHGSRIDYVLVSTGLLKYTLASDVQPDVHGSDHCPVYADLDPSLHLSVASENDKEMSNFTASQATLSNTFFKKEDKLEASPSPKRSISTVHATPGQSPKNVQGPVKKAQKTLTGFFTSTPAAVAPASVPVAHKPAIERSQSIEKRIEVSNAFSSMFQKPETPLCTGHQKPAKLQVCLPSTTLTEENKEERA